MKLHYIDFKSIIIIFFIKHQEVVAFLIASINNEKKYS